MHNVTLLLQTRLPMPVHIKCIYKKWKVPDYELT